MAPLVVADPDGEAAELDAEEELVAAAEPDAAEPEAEVVVEPDALAAAWKAVNVLAAVGLTAKTIPLAQ